MKPVLRARLVKVWLVLLLAQMAGVPGVSAQAAPVAGMELTVATSSANQQISLPIFGTVNSIQVTWSSSPGDVSAVTSSAGFISHTYPTAGTYTVKIDGTSFTQFGNGSAYQGSDLITSVSTFGALGIKSLNGAFAGASSLISLPATLPAGVTSMRQMLSGATAFNQNVGAWDVSTVTEMSGLFAGATSFNQNISQWNTSSVTDFSSMFAGATAFNNGENGSFAQNSLASSGTKWSMAKATNLSSMFAGATSFNQLVSNWDVTKVTNFSSTFRGATGFKQSVAAWRPHAASTMANFFTGGSWNLRTYDATLIAWAADSANPKGISFDAGSSKYSSAAAGAVSTLTGATAPNFGWTINDAGLSSAKVTRTITWQTRPSDAVGLTDVLPPLLAVDSEGATGFTYSVAGTSSAVCSVNPTTGVITVIFVGDCTYTASIAEDTFALAASLTTTSVIKPVTPSEPRTVSAVVTGRDIAVSWTAPANKGGTGIASYIATASAGGSDYVCTAQSPALTCTIRGVSRGTSGFSYAITTNSVGKAFRTDLGLVSRPSLAISAIVDPPLDRTATFTQTPALEVDFGPLGSVAAVDSLGVTTPTYAIDPASTNVCSIDAASGALTALRSGMCYFVANVAADPDRRAATSTGLVKIRPFTPGAPTITSAVVDGRNITVNFDAPVYDGGYDLGHYVFTASNLVSSFSCEVQAPATSCTISDVSRGDSGFDYSITGVTHGAVFDGRAGLISVESAAETVHIDAPLVTALAWQSKPAQTEPFGALKPLEAAEPNQLGTVVYSVLADSVDVCSVAVNTGEITALRAGDCNYRADIFRTPDIFASAVYGSTHITTVQPSAPLDVSAQVDGRQITVSWSPSLNDGGISLTDYYVTADGGGNTYVCHVPATENSCVVQDVSRGESGLAYDVAVRARNASFDALPGLYSASSASALAQIEAPLTRTLFWQSVSPEKANFGPLTALRVAGDLNGVTPNYSVRFDSQAVCRVDPETGQLTALRAGTCHFSSTVIADADFHQGVIEGSTLISPVAPSQPLNVSTSVDGRNITISWSAPIADGGNGIEGYRVDLLSGVANYSCTVLAPLNECVISAVTRGSAGVTYSVSVRALGQPFMAAESIESSASDTVEALVTAPISSIVTWQSAPAAQTYYGALPNLAVVGNQQSAAPVFTIEADSDSVCRVNPSTGELSALRVGLCKYRAQIAADPDHAATDITASTLILASPPSQPRAVSAIVNGRDVTVSWSAPLDDGGNGFSGYHITLGAPGQKFTCEASADTYQCKISGVNRGVEGYNYVAKVQAIGASFNGGEQQLSAWSEGANAPVDAPIDRRLAFVSSPQGIENFGPLTPVELSGDLTAATLKFSVSQSSADFCSINASSGRLTALHAGICNYRVEVDADPDHFASLLEGQVVIRPITPTVPRDVKTLVDGRNLTITWSKPAADGGNGLAGYNVKVQNGDQVLGCDTVFGQNSCQLAALDRGAAGLTYLVNVRAIANAFDVDPGLISEWSVPANAVIAGPAVRALNWSTRPDAASTFGQLTGLQLGGDLAGATPTYAVNEGSVDICSVDPATGALTALKAGLCIYSASVLGDGDHQPGLLASSTIIKPAPPATPKNITAAFDGQKIIVTWQPPFETGGSILEAYVVTAASSSGNLGCRVSAAETSCILDGLVQGAHYEISVLAINADIPQAKGVASEPSSTTSVDVPAPPVEPTPTPTAEPTPEPTPTPTPEPKPTPPPKPTIAEPAAVAQATLNAVTLAVSAAAAAAGAAGAASGAAGAASGATGGAAGGSSGAAGGPKGEAKGGAEGEHKTSESLGESAHLRHLAKGNVDAALKLAAAQHWGDKLAIWALPVAVAFDAPPKRVAQLFSRVLPLASKVFIDGTYLRAMFGSLWILLSIIAATLGLIGAGQTHGELALPSTAVTCGLIAIGIFDVFAGFVGTAVLAIGLAVTVGASSAGDARMLFGIMALGVTPRVISGAFRTLRRPRLTTRLYLWERFVDLIAAPMLAAWASLQIVDLLPALSGGELEIESIAKVVPTVVAICMVARVGLEEVAGRYFPIRVEITQTDQLAPPPLSQLLISTTLRAATFAFIAEALIGNCWQLYAGALIFVMPNLLTLIQNRLPNSTTLYHIMPQGLANLALSLWIGAESLLLLTAIFGETPDLARIGFILLPLPSLAMSVLKLFGRKGKEGEARFYAHPRMVWFYRLGGIAVLYATAELIHTINTTTLF